MPKLFVPLFLVLACVATMNAADPFSVAKPVLDAKCVVCHGETPGIAEPRAWRGKVTRLLRQATLEKSVAFNAPLRFISC